MSGLAILPNLADYDSARASFSWEQVYRQLDGLPGGGGLNIAHEALDRFVNAGKGEVVALRWIRKDMQTQDFSYLELKLLTNRFANLLSRLGILKGETVYSLLGRLPELYISALGSLKAGAVFCPLFSVFGPEPVYQRLLPGKAALLVTTRELFEKKVRDQLGRLPFLRFILLVDIDDHLDKRLLSFKKLMEEASEDFRIPPTRPEDPALLHFTSGTTGKPKGALHVHGAVLMHYMTGRYALDFHAGDIFWCTADPGWVTGTSYGIIAPLVNGVTNIVDEADFDALRWYSILESQQVNIWYTAPTAIRRLMRLSIKPTGSYHLEHLRLICSVGEPLPADAVLWGEKMFGRPILDNWWQTETGGIMIANFPSLAVKPGSMGKPLPGITASVAELTEKGIRILEEPGQKGLLVIKTGWPSMFRTYLNEQDRYDKCFRDGWYITGDMASIDRDGYCWFAGRADDIIKTSGHMVGPYEVETVLLEHPAVAEAAVIGKPDALIGELVKAFVVLKEGFSDSPELRLDISAFARKKLGPAVAPKELAVTAQVPKTRSGKILRRLLKARELGLPEGDLSTLEQT